MRRIGLAADVPGLDHLLPGTDTVINIHPDLGIKADIIQNAIDQARLASCAVAALQAAKGRI